MKKLKAFTLTEIVVAILVITTILTATLSITKSKMEKVDRFYYYMAFSIARDISQNIVAQGNFAIVEDETADSGFAKFAKGFSDFFISKLRLKNVYAFNAGAISSPIDMGTSVVGTQFEGVEAVPAEVGSVVESTPDDIEIGQADATSVDLVNTASDLCNEIIKMYNIGASTCGLPASTYSAAVTSGDFSAVTPHVVLNNGLRLFIVTDFIEIPALATEDESVLEKDKQGYILYVDSDGAKGGKSRVNSDIFAFYLLKSGKMVPVGGLNRSNELAGADSTEHLSVNVRYDDFSTGNRVPKILMKSVDYKTGVCASGIVLSQTYCTKPNGTIIQKNALCTDVADCRIQINRPMRKLF